MLASHGETVVMEDPVYPGLRNAFQRGGARVIGAPVGETASTSTRSERLLEKERPRLIVLTPNFQNPTGTTIPLAIAQGHSGAGAQGWNDRGRKRFVRRAALSRRRNLPSMKRLDESGDTILLGSFSKIAFPGLRVGWAIGPRHFIARLD